MQQRMILISGAALLIVGCTHTDNGDIRFLPDKYINNIEYNSIYHYGYNQGCESALAKAKVAGHRYNQDLTLNDTSMRFNKGWQQGYSACKAGKEKMLYNLSQTR
ncbi:hypothetical protein C0W42_03415 [Photobacterium kishitanii]|uniref:hypothetical protein n=1 Tax=Photobacterium kishitanii TaxID=318456 RepID=UPI000D17A091|nr:hypothetical protein [Photobacterium kishitanii]PSU91720.1 hypothetical protein C0W42_03415 [Photobacterium kishitanii]PSV22214.1 hypothetical protein C0W28_06255 [Photobacterium kishitanii]